MGNPQVVVLIEGYYASVVYSIVHFLAGIGLEVVAEKYMSWGRIDLVVRVEGKVYLTEFKVIEDEEGVPLRS